MTEDMLETISESEAREIGIATLAAALNADADTKNALIRSALDWLTNDAEALAEGSGMQVVPDPSPPAGEERSIEAMWQDLIEMDDRTSPADSPEMALITFEEFSAYLTEARALPIPVGDVQGGDAQDGTNLLESIAFLTEAARYFESRPTKGEDATHWSNVYNAANCRKIIALLVGLSTPSPSPSAGGETGSEGGKE
jgi:hypothetical protein